MIGTYSISGEAISISLAASRRAVAANHSRSRSQFSDTPSVSQWFPRLECGSGMATGVNHEIRLAARPVGFPKDSDFELAETPIPEPGDGEVLVRNVYMSVDPYMRARMDERKSYAPSFQVGEAMTGGAVGQVVESRSDALAVGDWVNSMMGWREYYVADGGSLMKIDPALAPVSKALGVLGLTGWTAYVGLLDLGQPKEGETVFVSAAAGAVGSIVGQLAKLKGCRVVGSAGSPEKAARCREIGYDDVFDYKKETPADALDRLCPDGIDVYFENVGGDHLDAALRTHARVRPDRRLRPDLAVQRHRAEARSEPRPASHEPRHDPRLHRLRPLRPAARLPARHGRVVPGRQDHRRGDRGRGDRERPDARSWACSEARTAGRCS